MPTFTQITAILCLILSPCFAAEPATAPAALPALSGHLGTPIDLFNGKDLHGWVWVQRPPKPGAADAAPVPIDAVWQVKDGLLHDAGKPIGYIRTETQYHSFILHVEQRHVSKGNGGILFAISGPDKVWPHCFECQGQNGEEADLRGIANFHVSSDPARTEAKRVRHADPAAEKTPGDWETFEITVDHGHITLKLNGVVENTATTADDLTGHIGIQAEGGEIEYRKIQLIPIE